MNARLHSLGAGPLLVAQVAWVRIPVKAFFPFYFFFFLFAKKKNMRGSSALEIPAWSPTAVLIELKGA